MKDLTPFILFAIMFAVIFAAIACALMFVDWWKERRVIEIDAKIAKNRKAIGFNGKVEEVQPALA